MYEEILNMNESVYQKITDTQAELIKGYEKTIKDQEEIISNLKSMYEAQSELVDALQDEITALKEYKDKADNMRKAVLQENEQLQEIVKLQEQLLSHYESITGIK